MLFIILMSLQLAINLQFLEKLEPPTSFPPQEDQIMVQLQTRFLGECERFISNEKTLYKCSKAVEGRLSRILVSSMDIEKKLASEKDRLDLIAHELKKYRLQENQLKEKEKILRMLCELVRMEDLRKDLLLGQIKKEALEAEPKPISVNEEEYLRKLQRMSQIIKESESISHFKEEFPLVKEIVLELQAISKSAIKFIIKRLLTPKMVGLILNQFYHIFSDAQCPVLPAVVALRLQTLKISLNPMINNLNYATNIHQLYESIFTLWQNLISDQMKLFQSCKRVDLVKSINFQLMGQLLPKMEKNVFKVKELVPLVKIRKYYYTFYKYLRSIDDWSNDQRYTQLLISALNKCQIMISSKLSEQSESLQNSKYNIYTITSYYPIGEHLQKILACYECTIDDDPLDWEIAFYNLCTSRDPKNYPNNKSLLIFNLNIWYVYLKLIPNGKHRAEGEELLKWCYNTFATINVQQANKKYYESFEKILELCGNLPAFKATLYAEVSLLGHNGLRREVTKLIKSKYLQNYTQTLVKIEKTAMSNEEVKAFCHSKKINLNKFGKYSHSICIYSPEALEELLEYA